MDITESIGKSLATVQQMSELTNIPADRIYKWKQGKAKPDAADSQLMETMFQKILDLDKKGIKRLVANIPNAPPPGGDNSKRRIPFIGEGIAGTDMELNVTDTPHEPDYIDVGDLLKDSEAAFIVYGNSMTPAYPPGCVLGIRRNNDNFIQPGETYLLLTKSNRIFKRLYYTDDKKGFTCVSDNILKHEAGPMQGKYFYPPFDVQGEDVISVFDITGMIKRNRNSGIMQRQ